MEFSLDNGSCQDVGPITIPNDSLRWYFIWAGLSQETEIYFAVKSFDGTFFKEISTTTTTGRTGTHIFSPSNAGINIGNDENGSFENPLTAPGIQYDYWILHTTVKSRYDTWLFD